ncbi:NmrA-like family domain-containing protein [Lachnellula hyalina]|uniref:NmrA-like family domain-containing protein n=1 Tax=Lachnellula hyalina TaxID=1316788 RepID=A0A8H8R0Z1_9HELO|nr:NmrA-like family domain-containing protein [Lachnellula hyalina]TVY26488.1 NmrA-like family domain-containing protein [Lachnellula hyalina]
MTTLRKACGNCTASKRKCIIQLPQCTRCTQKGLECRYDLEPLSAPTGQAGQFPDFSFNPSNCDSPGYCIMKTLKFRASDIDPAICRPGHEDAFEVLRLGFRSVPVLARAGKPAVFLHPKLEYSIDKHFAGLGEMGDGGVCCESFKRLVEMDVKTVPVKEALAALQALLVYLATFFFSSQTEQENENAGRFLTVLSEWTQALLAAAPNATKMPRKAQSPWQEWLLGESIRRTIIMSYVLSLALSGFQYGYCSNWLFVESLPFDRRAGLWMAESPQAWIAAAEARNGDEVGQQLNSLHEFAESLDGSPLVDPSFRGDVFLMLLVYAHNGVGASAIFSVTDFWQSFANPSQREKASSSSQSIGVICRENEAQQNRNIINAAAKVTTLERLVFSSLPSPNRLSAGKYAHVYHFDGKAMGEDYGRSAHPKLWAKTNVLYAGYYLENYFGATGHLFRPRMNKAKDTLILSVADPLATTLLPMYSAVADTGTLVQALLRAAPGKRVIGVNQWLSVRDFAKVLAREIGKKIEFVDRNPSFDIGDPDVEKDYADMMGFCIEFGYEGGKVDKSIVQPADLGVPVHLESVEEWCKKQDWEKVLQVD